MSSAPLSNATDTLPVLRQYIREHLTFSPAAQKITDDDSLVARGVIDSTGVLELVAYLEEHFKIRVEDDELLPENLDSIRNLSSFIERKRAHVAA